MRKITALLVFSAVAAMMAQAGPMAYVSLADGRFGTMDLTSGAFSVLGTPFQNVSGLAYGPGGKLYGSDFDAEGLYLVNPSDGTGTLVGTMAVQPGDITGIAGVNGNLYTVGNLQQLYRVNASTAATTLIGSTGITPITDLSAIAALTIAADASNIYWSNRTTTDTADRLYRVNPATGAATLLGNVQGADFLAASGFIGGKFYLFTFEPNNIYTLDLNTLQATLVGSYNDLDAPVFGVAAVPEPAGLAIGGLALIGIGIMRSRRTTPLRHSRTE